MLDLIRLSMCYAMLGLGDTRWEMEKLRAVLSNPLRAPTHQEPQHVSTSSWSLTPDAASAAWTQAGLQLQLMICCAAIQGFSNGTALAEHQPWRGAQDFLVVLAIMENNFQGLCDQHDACFPGLLLGMRLPGTQSNSPVLSDDSALSVGNLSIFHTAATQELGPKLGWCPQEVWAGANTSTMEPSCTLPWKDHHR